jgi:hypothetical protein
MQVSPGVLFNLPLSLFKFCYSAIQMDTGTTVRARRVLSPELKAKLESVF